MAKYAIELFQADDAILARGEREAASLSRDEMLAWAREAAEKFGIVWNITDKVRGPTLGYARLLCDGSEVLRMSIPSELNLQ